MNLNTELDLDFKRFWRWWGRELAFLIPEKLRRALSEQSGLLLISADDDSLNLRYQQTPAQVFQVKLPLNDQGLTTYQRFKSEHPQLEKAETVLRLTPPQALTKIVYLPSAALENLQQVMAFELDRYTPYKPEQVYFSAKLLNSIETGQIQILLALTPKDKLAALLEQLKPFALQPAWIDCEQAPNDFERDAKPYNLLPETMRPRRNKLAQWLHGSLWTIVAGLSVAILVLPVWQQQLRVDSLRSDLKRLEKAAHAVEEQQQQIEAMQQETQRLISLKTNTPSLVAMLNALSELMKSDTWLTHLQYNDRQLQIQGQSPAASALIGLLEQAAMFSQASFVSPLTQDKATGLERFQISVTVTAEPEQQAADTDSTEEDSTSDTETTSENEANEEAQP